MDLSNVKVGDLLYRASRFGGSFIRKVKRLTPAMVVLEGYNEATEIKVRKKDGKEPGHETWNPVYWRLLTPEVEAKFALGARLREARQAMKDIRVDEANLEKVEAFLGVSQGERGMTQQTLGWKESHFKQKVQHLVDEAAAHGVIITVEQVPLKPLAMGHYETVVRARPARIKEPK